MWKENVTTTSTSIARDGDIPAYKGVDACWAASTDDTQITIVDRRKQLQTPVNCSGVKPRSFFPWIGRTRLGYHRSGRLERYQRPRSGRPQTPMPAVATATPTFAPVAVC